MEFRWVAAITLWTFIAGPAFGPPPATNSPLQSQSRAAAVQRKATPAEKGVRPPAHRGQISRAS